MQGAFGFSGERAGQLLSTGGKTNGLHNTEGIGMTRVLPRGQRAAGLWTKGTRQRSLLQYSSSNRRTYIIAFCVVFFFVLSII